ncbi:S1 RNA-binding domain-containing protein [Streptococcus pneumoniae]|nr:S1 RNA-binding domain-containing protein [Streptococcus pneumoniae]
MCFTHSFFHFAILRKSLQTTSASSTTSKQCFEQPAANFLVCSLIFIDSLHCDLWSDAQLKKVSEKATAPV